MRKNIMQVLGSPVLAPTKAWPEFSDESEGAALLDALHGGDWGIESTQQRDFEREYGTKMGLPQAFVPTMVTNGTHALEVAGKALDIGYGDRVLVPALTWQASAAAFLDVNAFPVLLDVEDDWTLSVDAVRHELEQHAGTPSMPVAIVAVHLMNRAAHVKELLELAQEHGVWLIEDCAQSAGAVIHGRPAGTWGVVATGSKQSSKPEGTGEGGSVLTGVRALDARIRTAQSCGRRAESEIPADAEPDELAAYWTEQWALRGTKERTVQSGNYRMQAMVAGLGRAALDRFAGQRDARNAGLAALDQVMPSVAGITWYVQPAHITSPVAYRIGFEYDPAAFGGLSNEAFRKGLAHLLGGHDNQKVEEIYEPLTHSPFYQPLANRQYRINDEQMRAIDPRRFSAPNADRIWKRAVTIEQSALREPEIGTALPAAIEVLRDKGEELAAAFAA